MHLRLALWLVMIGVLSFATRGLAQILPSDAFDPSIEAAGMGGASIAAFWEENPNDHGNPALMGFHSGLRYSYGTTKLLPEFSDDVKYVSHRILAGASIDIGSWGDDVPLDGRGRGRRAVVRLVSGGARRGRAGGVLIERPGGGRHDLRRIGQDHPFRLGIKKGAYLIGQMRVRGRCIRVDVNQRPMPAMLFFPVEDIEQDRIVGTEQAVRKDDREVPLDRDSLMNDV